MARILVIDDEDCVRATVRRFLTSAGHEVVEAEDGESGVLMQKIDPFDLIITDIVMPRKEGLETIADIRRAKPNQKIIAMTGGGYRKSGQDLYVNAAETFGAAHVLIKPFGEHDLMRCVNDCL